MENVSLKKGLFGYTQSSVQEYIEALNGELTARTNKLVLENEELKKKCELYEDKINESNAKQDELLEKINALGIGPGGLGGSKTALAVNVETYPTHIAGLPVAVNICCHVNRHVSRVI